MSSWKKEGAVVLGAVVVIVAQHVLGLYWGWMTQFNQTVLGRLLPGGFLSAALLPSARRLFTDLPRARRIKSLLATWQAQARSGTGLEIQSARKRFLKTFGHRPIDAPRLKALSKDESAAFLLGLQFFYADTKLAESVDFIDLGSVAERAFDSDAYRQILVALSLSATLFSREQVAGMTDQLLDRVAGFTRVRYKSEDEDQRFFDQLERAEDENVAIFSTTSQMSQGSLTLIREHARRIKQFDLFLVSPLMESDTAIKELQKEHDVPKCALPPSQFIQDVIIDSIRRVIRVLIAVESTLEFQRATGLPIIVWFFRKKYPEIKIRLLTKSCYLQLLPGPLHYANNLYRFGIEIKEAEKIKPVAAAIQKLKNDPTQCTKLELNAIEFTKLRERALREAAKFVYRHSVMGKLDESRPKLRFILRSSRTDEFLDDIASLVSAGDEAFDKYDLRGSPKKHLGNPVYNSKPPRSHPEGIVVRSVGGFEQHVSVGIMFIRDSDVLFIEKTKPPYAGMTSIVAGHVAEGETPTEAIEREVREELGIVLDHAKCELVRHFDDMEGDICRYGAHHHEWYVFVTTQPIQEADMKLAKDEILSVRWEKLDAIAHVKKLTYAATRIFEDLGLR